MAEYSETSGSNFFQDDIIVIRRARPDFDEGLVVAKLFDEAAEGFFKSMLGTKTYEIIADAYTKPNNEYSFENVTVIEDKGAIVGMVSGYTYSEKLGHQKNILSQFANGAKHRRLMFTIVGKILSRFLGPAGKEDYYLQAIALDQQVRGRGLGLKLIEYSEKIAIDKGSKTLSLAVSSKNAVATKFYKKYGMEVLSHWPGIFKLPPIFIRMVKKIIP